MLHQLFILMFILTFNIDPRVEGQLIIRRGSIFCKNETCREGQYCSKRNFCRLAKYDGMPCKLDKHCKSSTCLDQVCRACRVDGDCPFRYKIFAPTKTYCMNNSCVDCKLDDHCKVGMVCTRDNRCEECDSDDDCVEGVCSKAGTHNWCVQCYTDDHCPDSQRCSYGKCVECIEDSDCSTGRCHLAECVPPVCHGVCSSDSGCLSGSCYIKTGFLRGARTKLFGYCKSCD